MNVTDISPRPKMVAPDVENNGVYLVTPEIAAKWLERNNRLVKNRPVNKVRVQFYADAISRGEWKLNGDTIRFSSDGDLIDGQHRLMACLVSGTSFYSFVVFGLDKTVFDTIDNGMMRTSAHTLAIRGEKNCAELSGALTLLWKYLSRSVQNSNMRPTNQQIERMLDHHPNMRDAVSLSVGKSSRRIMSTKAIAAFMYYAAGKIDYEKRDKFFEFLITGASMTEGHPVLLLRDRLLSNKTSKAKLPHYEIFAITIKAWNAFYAGKKMQNLRWISTGERQEPFPRLTPDPFV